MRRILVPVSGPSCEKAFTTAAEMAATSGARLVLVNLRHAGRSTFPPHNLLYDEVDDQERHDRRARLADCVKFELGDLQISAAIEEVGSQDDPVERISDLASWYEVDLIVLNHGQGHTLEESDVHNLVDSAPCDVLVMRTGSLRSLAKAAALAA